MAYKSFETARIVWTNKLRDKRKLWGTLVGTNRTNFPSQKKGPPGQNYKKIFYFIMVIIFFHKNLLNDLYIQNTLKKYSTVYNWKYRIFLQ